MSDQILLINSPVSLRTPHSRLTPPLGLAYLGAMLMKHGYSVSAIDFNVSGFNPKRLARIIETEHPKLVGISAYTESFPNALTIARQIKSHDNPIQVVMGGPHPSILPAQVLEEASVDYVVKGEGEGTLVELAETLFHNSGNLKDIRGLCYRDHGIRINDPREPLDPDDLPFPARDLFPLEFYPEPWNILAARGDCPFKCPFCSASAMWSGPRKTRKPENIIQEIRMLQDRYNATDFFFVDDVFTLNRPWTHELLDRFTETGPVFRWGCSTRVDLVDEDLLAAMAKAGCTGIQYGIESGAQRILDSVKGIQKKQAINAVKTSVRLGMDVVSSFMIPFPDDTRDTLKETADLMKTLKKEGSRIVLSYTTPLPGTYFHKNADALGIRMLSDHWDEFDAKHPVFETRYLTLKDLQESVEEIIRTVGLETSAISS